MDGCMTSQLCTVNMNFKGKWQINTLTLLQSQRKMQKLQSRPADADRTEPTLAMRAFRSQQSNEKSINYPMGHSQNSIKSFQ